jgi:ribosome-associated protein
MDDPSTPVTAERLAARDTARALGGDALLAFIVDALRERRAAEIVSLDVRELVEYMDHLVIATGRSRRQNKALAEHVLGRLKREHRVLPLSRSGMEEGSWVCLDFVDVVVHLFDAETRAHYDLELRWADAPKTEHASAAGSDSPDLDDDAPDGTSTPDEGEGFLR